MPTILQVFQGEYQTEVAGKMCHCMNPAKGWVLSNMGNHYRLWACGTPYENMDYRIRPASGPAAGFVVSIGILIVDLIAILNRYAIEIPDGFKVTLAQRHDGFIDLVILGGPQDYIMPVGTVEVPLPQEAIARMILCVVSPERAKSPYFKYEDWDTLEAEAEG